MDDGCPHLPGKIFFRFQKPVKQKPRCTLIKYNDACAFSCAQHPNNSYQRRSISLDGIRCEQLTVIFWYSEIVRINRKRRLEPPLYCYVVKYIAGFQKQVWVSWKVWNLTQVLVCSAAFPMQLPLSGSCAGDRRSLLSHGREYANAIITDLSVHSETAGQANLMLMTSAIRTYIFQIIRTRR